jgi:hypothetical protein
MGRSCSLCSHPERAAIDEALLNRGTPSGALRGGTDSGRALWAATRVTSASPLTRSLLG